MPFSLLKYGLNNDYPFEKDADLPAPSKLKSHYDVVIIGGGGHGVATAYYLAKYHGITNVAVLEKGYLGGGNTARNTAVIRSNYLTSEGVKFYSESVKLYQDLSNEFDFNIMYSRRGQLTLAHTDSAIRAFRQRTEVNKHFGGKTELIGPQEIRELVPTLNMNPGHMPVLAGLWHMDGATARHDAVAWGYAKGATQRGVELHQLTEVTGVKVENGKVTGIKTNRGDIGCGVAVQAVAGHSSILSEMAGFRLPIVTYPLQAMVTQPVKPFLNPLVSSPAFHCYVQQTGRGEIVIGGGSDPYPLYGTRSNLDLKEGLLAHAVELFPFMSNLKLMRQWAGITDMTSDYSPIMGLSPVENYFLDAGWGTWGFKATPICGKTMAELVASGGKVPELIQPFAMDRFDTFRQVNEMGATAASH
ncbi:MAG: sarcosine oxidase subunit beta [Oceanospirillaceae bacterium]|uniref:FAD-dependent oxidoreductase n=1 Tax=unclassified Thalassolituus TaxID=2624967 RepID=UPI000C091CCC|nr:MULTISPECIES: FAD-dependent oxidoreductase [unclassified Thalassolituus]MAK91770.1 sarcosine oxidase subunit beta [Thalassolituus sp.]MAS23818.1 sarcosine oxidase subunit beta [Oceanospirillaceae bacterium]MAY00840.1 sarcosine oxidase subunit beta [Oceanospirillaceae bacterium]MBL36662.1 sarcosine oxidase subunit beta [Oceanospirillaceae bacterium]MBS54446.1 sarcosine oxidase subunit beta [Oceanospirillaceae bacterium]